MANENQYYKFTFAELGNYSVIPDQASSGNVDYESGFGPDYEKVGGEADRKLIERETFNGLMQGVTKNLKQWQERNFPTWIENNGDGSPFTYIEGSVVDHNGFYWVATEDADTEPSDAATTWRKFKPNSTVEVNGEGGALTQSLSQVQTILNNAAEVFGANSLQSQGYQLLGNGLIFQWGTALFNESSGETGDTYSFPIAFPNACLNITGSDIGNAVRAVGTRPTSKTQYTVWAKSSFSNYSTTTITWFAVGY